MATQPTGEAYEEEHVHTVYEQIASHFSSTRYKVRPNYYSTAIDSNERMLMYISQPWPIIERFLKGLEPGSVGLDVGCGNGKYLAVNHDIFIVGSDRYAHNLNAH
jgi:tRNA (uracil-5-)-methyltransferase TRM9